MGSIVNYEIRRKTGVIDIAEQIAQLKWHWARYVGRRTGGLWGRKASHWEARS